MFQSINIVGPAYINISLSDIYIPLHCLKVVMLCFVIGRYMIVDSFFLCVGRVFISDMHAKRYLFILKASL